MASEDLTRCLICRRVLPNCECVRKIILAPDEKDMVNKPPHYSGKTLQAIDVIEDFDLGYNLGNAIKYILRAGKKGNKEQDLEKAIWYLNRDKK